MIQAISITQKCVLADLVQVTCGGDSRGTWMFEDIAEETGYDKDALRHYKRVAENIESGLRNPDLGWSRLFPSPINATRLI